MATRIDITLEELHHLQARVDRHQLAAQDWPVVAGLVSMLIARTEARQDRLRAKAAQQQEKHAVGDAAATEESSEPALDGEPARGAAAGPGEPPPSDSTKPDPPKGHGRNGADAFVNATTHVHCLAAGIIGAICVLCGVGRVFAYRDKVIIRVVGQSLFRPERHVFQQGYCRLCGAIFTATGSELVVRGGIGTSYIIYDWSACAMLIVMHYFAGAPFKRLEALHQGWGVQGAREACHPERNVPQIR